MIAPRTLSLLLLLALPASARQESPPEPERPTPLAGARRALDACGFVRILRRALVQLHPALEGVGDAAFDERTLAALGRRLTLEPERARRAELDADTLAALAAAPAPEADDEPFDTSDFVSALLTDDGAAELARLLDEEKGEEREEARRGSSIDALARALLPRDAAMAPPKVAARLELLEDALLDGVDDPFTQVIHGDEFLHDLMLELLQIPNQLGLLALPAAGGAWEIGVVLRDTDAEAKGIRAGDRLLAIDGVPVAGLPRNEVQERMAKPCRLRLQRGEEADSFELSVGATDLARAASRSILLEEGVGYLSFPLFREAAFYELLKAGRELQKLGARVFILDLRGNPGGLLSEAQAIAGLFLPEGATVAKLEQRRPGRGVPDQLVSGRPAFPDVGLVVLIDRSSASASEILAAALDDHGRALLTGQRTFGKGVGQTTFSLPIFGVDERSLMPRLEMVVLTTIALRSPNGRDWQGVGIEPRLRASPADDPRERRLRRAALLDDVRLFEELSQLRLSPAEVADLRRSATFAPVAAATAARRARLPCRTPAHVAALKDAVRIAQRELHPELAACPELDPALQKALAAARIELSRSVPR